MDGKSPEIVIADSLVAIANALERIADGQALTNRLLLRLAESIEDTGDVDDAQPFSLLDFLASSVEFEKKEDHNHNKEW